MFEITYQERLAGTLAGDYRLSGDEINAKAREWITDHPEEWQLIESRVREYVMAGKKFSLREAIINPLKWEYGFPCSNTYTASFQRILNMRIPGYKNYARMNKSKVDG